MTQESLQGTVERVETETEIIAISANSSFSREMPLLQLAWDSTSLGAFKTCPRYYQYSIIEGRVHRSENVHFRFGIEFHAGREFYDRLRAEGLDHEDSLRETVRFLLVRTWDETLRRPWSSDEPTKTRETLIRSVVWYLDQFQDDALETVVLANGKPAVELSFRFEPELRSRETQEDFLLCGHLDRMVRFHDKVWISDIKTTKGALSQEYFDRYSPDNQMSLYALAGTVVYHEPIAGLIIDACQVLVNGTRFQRGIVTRTRTQHEEWFRDLAIYLQMAESFALNQYWPQNDKSCSQYGGCPYRTVCGASPEVRARLLDALYVKRVWDPLVTREV